MDKLVGMAASKANVNVGVLGHVDSGKTRLARALSSRLSTAALDKAPQSRARGMTLDLGFSSFPLLGEDGSELQVTLVDCPGHASLFKTILGGVAIIDAALLVVDVTEGLQPQTIETLLVGALAVGDRIVVALTKTDLLPEAERSKRIDQVTTEIRNFTARHLSSICWLGSDTPIVPLALVDDATIGVEELKHALRAQLTAPDRDVSGPFRFAIDHCFAIPGNGTILTGTMLAGTLAVGDELELPDLGIIKPVKGLQVFHEPVDRCAQGDRVAVRVHGLDASGVERGIAGSPGTLTRVSQIIVAVHQVPFFQSTVKTGGKFHVTVGHATVMATATFFSNVGDARQHSGGGFVPSEMYELVDQIAPVDHDRDQDHVHPAPRELTGMFALLQFEQDVFCPPDALVVCSRLELDPKRHHCRLAFYGAVQVVVAEDKSLSNETATPPVVSMADLIVGRVKSRDGVVDKVLNPREVLGRDMFAKDVDWSVYIGTTVLLSTSNALGMVLGPFGKAGKFRIELMNSSAAKLPVAGEKLVLRFVKPAVIKLPKQKGKKNASGKAADTKTGRRGLLQDPQLLYPEAFANVETSLEPRDDMNTADTTSSTLTLLLSESDGIDSLSERRGTIERLKGETTADGRNPFAIVVGLFSNEQEATAAIGRPVMCYPSGNDIAEESGVVEKPFGKAGKVRVTFLNGTRGQPGDIVAFV